MDEPVKRPAGDAQWEGRRKSDAAAVDPRAVLPVEDADTAAFLRKNTYRAAPNWAGKERDIASAYRGYPAHQLARLPPLEAALWCFRTGLPLRYWPGWRVGPDGKPLLAQDGPKLLTWRKDES